MLVAPKTPAASSKRLHDETTRVRGQPGVVEKLKPQGLDPLPLAPAEFDPLIAKEIETNKPIVKAAGLKFN